MLKLLREYVNLLLTEAKSDQLKSRYPHLEGEIDELVSGGVETKYLDWAVRQLNSGAETPRLIDSLKQFHKNIQRVKNKDINSYKTLESLQSTVDSLGVSKRQASKEVLAQGSEKVGETDGYKIYYVNDVEASKKLGSGTQWCISGNHAYTHFWNYYFRGARFYFCISKHETIETDPELYKVAVTVVKGKTENYNAQDKRVPDDEIKELVELSLSDYEMKNREADLDHNKFMNHEDPAFRAKVAKNIDPIHLPQMMDDDNPMVRRMVAKRIDPIHLPQMMKDEEWQIRKEVAKRIDPEYLPQMMENEGWKDVEWEVREEVASRIDPEYLLRMLNDSVIDVRLMVAKRIDPKYLPRMIDEEDTIVQYYIAKRIDRDYLPQLLKLGYDYLARRAIAERIDPKYLPQMIDETNSAIRLIISYRIDPEYLPQMLKDPKSGSSIRKAIRSRLKELGMMRAKTTKRIR